MSARLAETILSLKVAYRCQNHCVFCGEDANRHDWAPLPSAAVVLKELEQAGERGVRSVSFVGGEPTLHPELAAFVRRARDLGYEMVHVCSNGRRLGEPGFLLRLVDAGLTHLDISVHADTAELGDRLAGRAGAFAQQAEGIRQAVSLAARTRLIVNTNTVIVRSNQDRLAAIVTSLARSGVKFLSLSLCRADGLAAKHAASMLPDLTGLRPQLQAALAAAAAADARVNPHAIPTCLLPPTGGRPPARAAFTADHRHTRFRLGRFLVGRLSPRLLRLVERLQDHAEGPARVLAPCRECRWLPACPAPGPDDVGRSGEGWLRPMTGE
jgi:MoaA/NifB/PqqE/SkfB family radical SAM enzyme